MIPGNHDIPYTFPARFTRPFAEFERQWETAEPVHSAEGLYVVGLNSVRPWRHQSGGIRSGQIARAAELLARGSGGRAAVVALHHHLIGAPWRSRKKPVSRRSEVLAGLVDAGAELILAGHIHQAAVSERHEFEVDRNGLRGVRSRSLPGSGSRGRTAAARRAACTSTRRAPTRSSSRPTSGARTTGRSPAYAEFPRGRDAAGGRAGLALRGRWLGTRPGP